MGVLLGYMLKKDDLLEWLGLKSKAPNYSNYKGKLATIDVKRVHSQDAIEAPCLQNAQ